jgi:hypothetical protein
VDSPADGIVAEEKPETGAAGCYFSYLIWQKKKATHLWGR